MHSARGHDNNWDVILMYLFVLKKTATERSPKGCGKLLEEMFSPAFRMDVSHSTQANVKSGTVCQYNCEESVLLKIAPPFLTTACVNWWVCA